MMQRPVARLLDGGERLHLQHGPIDLIIGADPGGRAHAFDAAIARFEGLLTGLVNELPVLRQPLDEGGAYGKDPVAQRMMAACTPYCQSHFLTPMAAVAGAVADEVLTAMCEAASLQRAYVNNGGDIALHLADGATFRVAMSSDRGRDLGRIQLSSDDPVRGIATSGAGGRSHSFGIAESVTVLAGSAAAADVAATLIANAVDLPEHPGIRRARACNLNPDSDLGERRVVVHVPELTSQEAQHAVSHGIECAREFIEQGLISAAAIFLQDAQAVLSGSKLIDVKTEERLNA